MAPSEDQVLLKLRGIQIVVFGTRDGVRPLFPRNGQGIDRAMKMAYELGKNDALGNQITR